MEVIFMEVIAKLKPGYRFLKTLCNDNTSS